MYRKNTNKNRQVIKKLLLLLTLFLSFQVFAQNQNIISEEEEEHYDCHLIGDIKKFKRELLKNKFQFPSHEIFAKKIKYYFSFDIDDNKNSIVELEDTPVNAILAIKNLPALYMEEEEFTTLFHFNNFIFHDDEASLTWLKQNKKDLLANLVREFDFCERDDFLQIAFDKIDFEKDNQYYLMSLIFGKRKNDFLYHIRTKFIHKIRELKFDNRTGDFSGHDVVAERFYYTLYDVIEEIMKRPEDYSDVNYTVAFLLNEQATSGIIGFIDLFYKNYPTYKKAIIDNDFYDLERLREYTSHVYRSPDSCGYYIKSGSDEQVYCVTDDTIGYVNIYQDKSDSSEIVQVLPTGEEVDVLDDSDNWYLIRTKDGDEGYVPEKQIDTNFNYY